MSTRPDPESPDCLIAKHSACTGEAFDHARDEPCDCCCECHA